ncbi:MAG: hypothetical protein H8D67_24285 [Deltaproteobacteria bacterium]|nr:hypothetical protein [Deltaproteobacteria bacterium]
MVEILEIKPIENGNLKAFVKLKIGDVVFHDFRIVQQPNQRAWVSAPVSTWVDEAEQARYKTIIELPPKLKREISEAVLNAYYESQAIAAGQEDRHAK